MVNDHLSISIKGLIALKREEAFKPFPYDDQTGKHITEWCKGATIGIGHLIPKAEWLKYKDGIDPAQATALLADDLKEFEDAVKRAVNVPLSQQQFDALVIFAFNIGAAGFRASSALKMINDPRQVTPYPTLERAWKAWNKSQGVECEGLNNRRALEWRIWSKGIYDHA